MNNSEENVINVSTQMKFTFLRTLLLWKIGFQSGQTHA